MNKSESLKSLTPDLLNASQELRNLAKTKKGYGYNYTPLSDVIDHAKPILAKHGLVCTQSVHSESSESVGITTLLLHTSGEWLEDTFFLPPTEMKGVNSVQKMGSSITYGRRYGLSAMLMIASDDDIDGTTPDDKKQQSPAQVQKEFNGTQVINDAQRAQLVIFRDNAVAQNNPTAKQLIESLNALINNKNTAIESYNEAYNFCMSNDLGGK